MTAPLSRSINRSAAPRLAVAAGLAALVFGPGAASVTAQTLPGSAVVGYHETVCPGGSDTDVSVPFHRPAAFVGAVETIRKLATPDRWEIGVAGGPGWTADVFAESHYARMKDGAAAGAILPVKTNAAGEITVAWPDLAGPLRSAAGDALEIIPFWTLATLLPPATQTALHPSTGMLSSQRGSELLLFNAARDGIEQAPEAVYFVTAAGWFATGPDFPSANDVIVPPNTGFIVRHQAGAAPTVFRASLNVDRSPAGSLISARQGHPRDTRVALNRPLPTVLGDLVLNPAQFAPSRNTAPNDRKDELLLFDNAEAAQNKTPAARFFRVGGHWRRVDPANAHPVADDTPLNAGAVLVIRKAPARNNAELPWVQPAN